MSITETIKRFVEQECIKPTSKYGYEPYIYHFIPMVNYALKLQQEIGGDREIIEIAAWLHDIGSIVHGRNDHHITGAAVAEEQLTKLHYPPEKIDLVKQCIYNHRGSMQYKRNTIEEQIIAEADVLSCFENIAGIFKAAYTFENLNQSEAKKSVRNKLQNKWKQLHFEKSKTIIRPKYEAAMLLLQ